MSLWSPTAKLHPKGTPKNSFTVLNYNNSQPCSSTSFQRWKQSFTFAISPLAFLSSLLFSVLPEDGEQALHHIKSQLLQLFFFFFSLNCEVKVPMKGSHLIWGKWRQLRNLWDATSTYIHFAQGQNTQLRCPMNRVFKQKLEQFLN